MKLKEYIDMGLKLRLGENCELRMVVLGGEKHYFIDVLHCGYWNTAYSSNDFEDVLEKWDSELNR